MSFAGGGSDISSYYEKFGGAVVSTTMNKYMFLSMHPSFFKDGFLLKYSKTENTNEVDKIEHPLIREVFRKYKIKGVDFNSSSDIPAGTGLGSSSAFTCGLIQLCNTYTESSYMTKEEIAAEACHVEIDILKDPIGKQDQYASACGGLNYIEFAPNGEVTVERLFLPYEGLKRLEGNLMLFYTGLSRSAGTILSEQKKNISDGKKIENVHRMVELAKTLKKELLGNNIDAMGEILHRGWMYKKELTNSISSDNIDSYYNLAKKNGAEGGKLLGAGGGGFLLFYVKEENHNRLRRAMEELKELPFRFDTMGTTTIYYSRQAVSE